jgi:hypothetical protein
MGMDTMGTLLMVATAIDVIAVGALGWLVRRIGRERDITLSLLQQEALGRLRSDLAELVSAAEQRGHALEESLGGRESRLRGLLARLERIEAGAPAAEAPVAPAAGIGARAEMARRLGVDAAEARLLRDLEISLGPRSA